MREWVDKRIRHSEDCIGFNLARMYRLTIAQGIKTYLHWQKRLADKEKQVIEEHCMCEAMKSRTVKEGWVIWREGKGKRKRAEELQSGNLQSGQKRDSLDDLLRSQPVHEWQRKTDVEGKESRW